MKKLRPLLFALLAIFAATGLRAQTDLQRQEIELESRSEQYDVMPVGEQGLVLYSLDRSECEGGECPLSVTLYDVNFQKKWQKNISVPKGFTPDPGAFAGNFLVVPFTKIGEKEIVIVVIDIRTGASKIIRQELSAKVSAAAKVAIAGETAIVGVNTRKTVTLLSVQCAQGRATLQDYDDAGGIVNYMEDVTFNPVTQQFDVIIKMRKGRTYSYKLEVFGANLAAIANRSRILVPEQGEGENEVNLLSARRFNFDENTEFIVGTYGRGERALGAQGVYVAKLTGGRVALMKYHSFTNFAHFFDYLPDRRQERVERRAERAQARGRDLNLKYQLLVDALIDHNDELVLVAEAYYAQYHTETRTSPGANGTTVTTTVQVFDGWRFTHGVVCAFSSEGELVWENSFPMWDILTMNLQTHIRVTKTPENEVALLYNWGGEIKKRIIRERQVITEREEDSNADEGVRVRYAWASDAAYWYGENFLIWGFERVRDQNTRDRRRVFYYAKVNP